MTKVEIITETPKEWEKVQKDWDDTPKAVKKEFYKKNAAMLDRWQAETDAMVEEEQDEK